MRILTLSIILILACHLKSQTNDPRTGHSPYYFGPNALPVMHMLSGETNDKLCLEVSSSFFHGSYGDQSFSPNLRVTIPLFSRWVNLDIWLPVVDYYYMPEQSFQHFIYSPVERLCTHGTKFGDIYISTNIQTMHHSWNKYFPDAVVRIGLKTASGQGFNQGRHLDCPAYFFDLTAGRTIPLRGQWTKSLRFTAAIGFLCWQSNTVRQNDAYTYGLETEFIAKYLLANFSWSGYSGWEQNNDRPMTLKAKLGIPTKAWTPYIAYQYGLRDYAYQEIRLGVTYSIEILNRKSKK